MMNSWHRVQKFIKYYLFSRHRRGYSVHSPFVYNFIRNVMMKASLGKDCLVVKNEFIKFAKSYKFTTNVNEVGAGSQIKKRESNLSRLADGSGLASKYLQLICEMISYFDVKQFLELGTCCGITSAAVALKINNGRVVTVEGNEDRADVSNAFFDHLNIKNIDLQVGLFNDVLERIKENNQKFDMAFIDGDHTYEATILNFKSVVSMMKKNGVIIIDDIYWSKEMTLAWQEIKAMPVVTVTIDINSMGIVFLNRTQAKEHFVVRY
jgi:predicted O-methyltransferase YrrM